MGIFGWSYPPGAENDPNAPYNQDDMPVKEDLIAGLDTRCPCCSEPAPWFQEWTQPGPENDLTAPEPGDAGWECADCGWRQDALDEDFERGRAHEARNGPRIAAVWQTLQRWREVRRYDREPRCTPGVLFADAPDGDFEWQDSEGGDWHAWACGERDCPVGWHKTCYTLDMGRKDGRRFIRTGSIDEDGNFDIITGGWDEGEDWRAGGEFHDLEYQSGDFFAGWAEYDLHALETGTDPLDEFSPRVFGPPDAAAPKWTEGCLKAAERNAAYLESCIADVRRPRWRWWLRDMRAALWRAWWRIRP